MAKICVSKSVYEVEEGIEVGEGLGEWGEHGLGVKNTAEKPHGDDDEVVYSGGLIKGFGINTGDGAEESEYSVGEDKYNAGVEGVFGDEFSGKNTTDNEDDDTDHDTTDDCSDEESEGFFEGGERGEE